MPDDRKLSARTEPFDSYWQAPEDVEKGYSSFSQYYKSNFLRHLPQDRSSRILVVSCGPGYFVKLLNDQGYHSVLGIDSDPEKISYAERKGLNCKVAQAFPFLESVPEPFDTIVCEQELNHLTKEEMVDFLGLCRRSLQPGGSLVVYGLNGANPITGAEALAQNFDHYNTVTEYTLRQMLKYSGFREIRVQPLHLYVFYKNPFNYVAWAASSFLSFLFRACFVLYGKENKHFTKKIAAICRTPA